MRATTRTRWPWLLLGMYLVQLGAIVYSLVWHLDRPLGGMIAHRGGPSELGVLAMPTNQEARRFHHGFSFELLTVNGRQVCETPTGPRCGVGWARQLIDTSPGAENRFEVRSQPDDTIQTLVLTSGPGELSALLGWGRYSMVMTVLGLMYAVIGAVVWRQRPADPAALPFLLFSVAVASTLGGAFYVDTFTLCFHALSTVASWLLMAALFLFAHSFATQADASRTLRFRVLLAFGLVGGLGEGACQVLSNLGVWSLRPWVEAFTPPLTAAAVVSLTLSLHSTWRAARPPSPLSQRRRARVLALAVALGFGYPTVWLIFERAIFGAGYPELAFWGLVVAFSTFPALIGYAMVRHRMFDLRIVMRQGLVYTLLSLTLALAYVAMVVGAYKLAGIRDSTAAPVIAAAIVAILFGVVRVRLERWIDAMVFRARAVFRRAMEDSGEALTQARRPADVAPALRPALIEALGLSRAYVLERDADPERVQTYLVDNQQDPETGMPPPELPANLALADHPPLSHCFGRTSPVQSVDAAVPRQTDGASFWDHYGLEASVPFGLSEGDRPVGLLLLGNKNSGRPLDPEDIRLVTALASQVALALSSARAFERLAQSGKTLLQLTQGIVHEANTPLGVLESSVDTLDRALASLTSSADEARRKRAAAGGQACIDTVRTSSDRLKALISDLKAYVNLEETDRVPTDLRACLAEVVRDAARTTGHAVELDCPNHPALVDGYPAKLRHILSGIVDNAITATPSDDPVRVELTRQGPQWLAVVRDTGTGMSSQTLASVFDFGIATKRTENRMGLRIGLPYARRVVEDLGGRISIRSQQGEGTEVRIGLPSLAQPKGASPDHS